MKSLYLLCVAILLSNVEGGKRKIHSKEEIPDYAVDKHGLNCAHEVVVGFLHTHPKLMMWLTKFETNRLFAYDTWKHCKTLGDEEGDCRENWKESIADGLNQLDEEATHLNPANKHEMYTKQLMTAINNCFPESIFKSHHIGY